MMRQLRRWARLTWCDMANDFAESVVGVALGEALIRSIDHVNPSRRLARRIARRLERNERIIDRHERRLLRARPREIGPMAKSARALHPELYETGDE